ncbi:MAG TPA: hypothetical protein PK280_10195 [Planctomycetota bacterium]|nr:hypothetical protein [Planctomycetota bacterium]
MATSEGEDLCRRCGRCCCRKFVIRDIVYHTPFFCPHLNPETRLCRVYEHRFEVNPQCLSVNLGLARGVFPADCPYTAGSEDYRAPVEHLDFFGLGKLARQIAEELEVSEEEFERVRREQAATARAQGGTHDAGQP